jgi:hypothetical protein
VASIFYDYGLTLPAPNPTQTDANGNFTVYAAALTSPNLYVVNAVPQLGTTYTWVVPGPASQGYISIPVPISQGGTFATTAAGAWTNIFSGAGITSNCTLLQNVSGTLTCTATTAAGALANLGGAALTGATFTGPVQDGTTVLPNQVNPAAFGTVDSTGVASSTAAFQAAINTGEQISVPPGVYNVCGLQPFVNDTFGAMMLVGPANSRQRQNISGLSDTGIFAATLQCASGDMFTMPSTATGGVFISVSGLKLAETSATNSGHIFNFGSSAYVVDFEMTDILFSQNNPAKSWIVGSGGMQEMTMNHIIGRVAGGNSVPGIQLDGSINVIDIADMALFARGLYGVGAYSAHYLFELNQNSGSAGNVHIHDSLCEYATAGCFNLNNVGNASVDDVANYDQPITPTGPFITIGSGSSQVEFKSVSSTYGTLLVPDLVCPTGVCEFHNSYFAVVIGGVPLDLRSLPASHYLDYTPAQQTDAEFVGVWATKDGLSGGGVTGNLATGSDGLTTGWYIVNGSGDSAPVTVTGISDPIGGTSAVQVTFSITTGYSEYRQNISPPPGSGTYTTAIYAKSCNAGGASATFAISDNINHAGLYTVPAAGTGPNGYTRLYSTALETTGTSQFQVGMAIGAGSVAGTQCLDLYGAQFTPGSAIHPYVSTTALGAAAPIQPRQVINGQQALYSGASTAVNGQTCAIGSTCTIPIQTNGSGNTSQAGINFSTSTANSVGLTITPTNPATNAEKFEVTGAYSGKINGPAGVLISQTNPTIASGFGASPFMTNANGTGFFTVNVGTGGTASTGTLTLPPAAHYWGCTCQDMSTFSTSVFMCRASATNSTTVSITNFNSSAVATPWGSGDYVNVQCYGQ